MAAIDDLSDTEIVEEGTIVASAKDSKKLNSLEERFQKAMDDDFNTALGLGILFDAVKIINKICQQLPANPSRADIKLLKYSGILIKKLTGIMGLLQEDAKSYLQEKKAAMLKDLDISEQEILLLIQEREDARAAKEWKRSDTLRDQLLAKGIELKDGSTGTAWVISRSNR
jgi:cysteinyl-tRNA synthetase